MKPTSVTNKVQPSIKAADLPPAVRVFWETAPQQFRLASILSAIVCYCALGTRLRARYVYDLDLHALLLQILVIGEPGSGKSFTRPIVKQLLRPLRIKDQEMKRIEQAYLELKKKAPKTKELPDEPITATRIVQTITKAKLVKRADMFLRKYGETLAFFFFSEELATMTDSNKRAFADLNTMDRLAYDLGAEFSSDTLSDASYNADVDIIYCSLFCGTENSLNDYINKKAVEGGNCTRKIVTRIDEDQMGEDAPVFRRQTDEEYSTVEKAVNKLMRETYTEDDLLQPVHEIPMEWIDATVRKWCFSQRQQVLKTGSRALNCFYKRSSVSAFRMTALLYHLWGEGMDENGRANPEMAAAAQKKCIRFYRFMAQYILDGLMAKWGKQYEQIHKGDDATEGNKVPLYDQLPKRFSRDQLRELITKLDLASPERVFISKWKKARLVHQPDPNVEIYEKNY